ncbi:hypothetical protein ACFYSC_29195 [Streptosporangium sp. NPDC004379]|uniref:hypothetical protein n=1 Tax=Streptosporangium sp. NPDC004379 TaxID=3366189 RepID=UPI0036763D2F
MGDRIHQEEVGRRLRRESLRMIKAGQGATDGWGGPSGVANWLTDDAVAYSAGRDLYYYVSSPDGSRVLTPAIGAEEVERIKNCLVRTESQERLTRLLTDRRVVLLRGPQHTGRATTAVAALLETTVSCHRLMIEDPTEVNASHLERDVGYLLRADGMTWAAQLEAIADHLADVAASSESRMVILADTECALPDRMVDHVPSAAEDVLRGTLVHLLGDPDAWGAYRLDGSGIDQWLSDCRPGDAWFLAERLAEGITRGRSIADVLKDRLAPRQTRLRKHLDGELSDLGLCFLVSGAVFHGLTEAVVSECAIDLARHLPTGRHKDEEPDAAPLRERLETWLGDFGITTVPGQAPGEGRRVHLGRQASWLLPKIWEELPGIREYLHDWLLRLDEAAEEDVQVKVAYAFGLISTCDFDLIEKKFFDKWSKSPEVRLKTLAAWALEAAVNDPQTKERAERLLREWARLGSPQQQVTAAMAYGSSIGRKNIDDALTAFRRVTWAPKMFRICEAVARSVADVYAAETARPVLAELVEWARSERPGARLAAALALARIAPADRAGIRPPLTGYATDDELTDLWIRSLEFDISSDDARRDADDARRGADMRGWLWQVFASWVAAWEKQPSLRPVIEGVFRVGGARDPRFRRTCKIHLLVWERQGKASHSLVRHLARVMRDTQITKGG